MSLNPSFMISPILQDIFLDPTTGKPLKHAAFFSDTNRSVPKTVYQLTGDSPNYSYAALPKPMDLTPAGTAANESGDDVKIYWNPYDDAGNIELYYVVAYDEDTIPTNPPLIREAWPDLKMTSTQAVEDVINYVSNGQFLVHNLVPGNALANPVIPDGRISQPETCVAPGFFFTRPDTSASTDTITFVRLGAFTETPDSSPRYVFKLECSSADPGDAFKYLEVRFGDVNKFAGEDKQFTFYLWGQTLASDVNITLYRVKNFGTGGSPEDILPIGTLVFDAEYQAYTTVFSWDTNEGFDIGPDNDDYCAIAIGYPSTIASSTQVGDILLTANAVQLQGFTAQTNENMQAISINGTIDTSPDATSRNWNLYLPKVDTLNGTGYDYGVIGSLLYTMQDEVPPAYLPFDYASVPTSGYSDEGIPYARLQQKWWISGKYISRFGGGLGYVDAYLSQTETNYLFLKNNAIGGVTPPADGAIATGFTFNKVGDGISTSYFKAYANGSVVWLESPTSGNGLPASGTEKYYFSNNAGGTLELYRFGIGSVSSATSSKTIFKFTFGASVPTAGTYIRIFNSTQSIVFWFSVNGSGSAPALTDVDVYVEIKLYSTMMAGADLSFSLASVANGNQLYYINAIAGSSIPDGAYFTFDAAGQKFCVYYAQSDATMRPALTGTIFIKVPYTTFDSSQTIRNNTVGAINMMYFATPDIAGAFPRIYDPTGKVDPEFNIRMSNNYANPNDIGGVQFDEIFRIVASSTTNNTLDGPAYIGPPIHDHDIGSLTEFYDGMHGESRPYNFYANVLVHL